MLLSTPALILSFAVGFTVSIILGGLTVPGVLISCGCGALIGIGDALIQSKTQKKEMESDMTSEWIAFRDDHTKNPPAKEMKSDMVSEWMPFRDDHTKNPPAKEMKSDMVVFALREVSADGDGWAVITTLKLFSSKEKAKDYSVKHGLLLNSFYNKTEDVPEEKNYFSEKEYFIEEIEVE